MLWVTLRKVFQMHSEARRDGTGAAQIFESLKTLEPSTQSIFHLRLFVSIEDDI